MLGGRDEEQEFEYMVANLNRVAVISLIGDLCHKHQGKFETFLETLKEMKESHYVIQCRDVTFTDQTGVQFIARIYSTIKNVKKNKFLFCSIRPELRERLMNIEAMPNGKIKDNLREAINKIINE